MRSEDQSRFPAVPAMLKDGRGAVIRPLSDGDGPALGEFYESVPPEDEFFYQPHPLTREQAAEQAAAADDPQAVVLVAQSADGRIAGYAWFRWDGPQAEASRFGICIRREFQGQGLGAALMGRLADIAGDLGPPVMVLTVQKANRRAVAIYMRMGFRIVREQVRRSDREPEYYMERRVR